jgi:hypothetical protein
MFNEARANSPRTAQSPTMQHQLPAQWPEGLRTMGTAVDQPPDLHPT